MTNVEKGEAIRRGYNPRLREKISELASYLFVLEKIVDTNTIKFVRDLNQKVAFAETYNKPFFITESMIIYVRDVSHQLARKLRENGNKDYIPLYYP